MSGKHSRGDAAKSELLARLGLMPSADDATIEEAHDHIVEYLADAPDDIRGWADRRQAEVDRIFALLTGPDSDLAPLAARLENRTPPAPHAPRRLSRGVLRGLAVLAVAAIVVGVYFLGKPADLPAVTPQGQQSAAATIDQARVAELSAKIEADPRDMASLQELSSLYFAARDYPNAKAVLDQILVNDPTNEKALVGSGAAAFNAGDLAAAEERWTAAVAAYPNNAEAHYDLGFLYMTTQRVDLMAAEWAKVVEIAPDSPWAQTIQTHSGAEDAAAATPTPGG